MVQFLTVVLVGIAVPAAAVPGDAAPAVAASAVAAPDAAPDAVCPDWPMYGADPARTFATDCPSAISPETVASLAPAWTFKTAAVVTASPVVADGRVFVGDWSRTLYALDAETGEELWRVETPPAESAAFGPIVSSAAVAGDTVYVGSGPRLYALAVEDGSERWVLDLGEPVEIESSPVVVDGVVYLGTDVHNRRLDGGPLGEVLAVDAATGAVRWRFDTGVPGCSSFWSSPMVDAGRGHLVVASGNCPHDVPWTRFVEAVTALDLDSGRPVWSFQPHEPNRRDWDFGATPNLVRLLDGTELIGAGNKDGHYYALDPRSGELVWDTQVAEPGDFGEDFSIGGYIGSPAVWEGAILGGTAFGGPPYVHGLAARDGAVRWQQPLSPTYAASAVVNGVHLIGGVDAILRAYAAVDGRLLWQAPLAGPISSGPAVVGDRVYVGSGTSASDACAKGTPADPACRAAFEEALQRTGAVHAFALQAPGHAAATRPLDVGRILLGGEENRLRAYDLDTLASQVVIPSASDDPVRGRDVNGQICAFPDGSGRIVLGEDTGQPDPPPHWGVFAIGGDRVGALTYEQTASLIPTYQGGPEGQENYGCGFLPDGRLLTTDVGQQYPTQPATGQLIVWFPPFTGDEVAYCKVDTTLATAGQLMVVGEDVYVAEARDDPADEPAGVYRYRGAWPTGPDAAGGCGRTDDTGAPLVDEGAIEREQVLERSPQLTTPSGLVATDRGTFYVSSVYDGVIAEYTLDGAFVREVLRPPGPPTPTTGTPFGIALADDGTLFYADLGVVGGSTQRGYGSVRRIRDGEAPETLAAGLDFPDGLGFLRATAPAPAPTDASQESSGHVGPQDSQNGGRRSALPATGGGLAAGAVLAAAAVVASRRLRHPR